MLLKSDGGPIIRRIIFILIIAICVYKFEVNHIFFGFWIALFLILFLISGSKSIQIDDNEIHLTYRRILPFFSKETHIKFINIIDIDYSKAKIDPTVALLNIFVAHAPRTSIKGGVLRIVEKGGIKHNIEKIGSEKKFQKAVNLIRSRTKN